MDKISCIYAIICTTTWRSYIGSTCNFDKRIESHLGQLRTNKHTNKDLQIDFNKYG